MHSRNVICSRLDIAQVPQLVDLLIFHKITLLGFTDRRFLRKILEDAANTGSPNIVIAMSPSQDIVGWTISIKHSRRYWQRFLLKHPVYFQKVLLATCAERFGTLKTILPSPDLSPQTPPLSWPSSVHVEWGQNSPTVARHIDITVLENHRHSGLGQALYIDQFKALKSESVLRVDACIRENNIPSQFFHMKQGWSFVKIEDGWVYITKFVDEG